MYIFMGLIAIILAEEAYNYWEPDLHPEEFQHSSQTLAHDRQDFSIAKLVNGIRNRQLSTEALPVSYCYEIKMSDFQTLFL